MTRWEIFLNELEILGIDTPEGRDPKALARGLSEALDIVENYEMQFEQMLLYIMISTHQMKLWKEACDRLEEINEKSRKELHQLPHNIIRRMKMEGLTPPKGLAATVPKNFETLDPVEVYLATKAIKEAKENQRKVNPLNPIPHHVMANPKKGSAMERAVAQFREQELNKKCN